MCTENFASLIGEQCPNDLVKKYRIGPEPKHASGQIQSISSLHQPNEWPTEESWDQDKAQIFKSTIERYFETICKVADCILRVICDGIIAENENTDIAESVRVLSGSSNTAQNDTIHGNDSKNHTSILTLLGYQPGSRHKKGHKSYMRPLISAHTDVGVITVLHFDGGKCAALERAANNATSCGNIISSENIEWIDVNLPKVLGDDDDPIFVINVGDCLSELSGGTLRSTLHRVMPRPFPHPVECEKGDEGAAPRTCLALFVGLEPTASLKLPHSGEVLSYEEWRRQRIARATAVMKR
jgi:isopenicillin N synthase-like dioxygenase